MVSQTGLIDVGFSDNKFTWTSNRIGRASILERLDRALVDNLWINFFSTSLTHLHRHCSDHCPLNVSIGPICKVGSSFRFINSLTRHKDFLNIVKEAWDSKIEQRPLRAFL